MKTTNFPIFLLLSLLSITSSFGQSENFKISAYADLFYAYDQAKPNNHQRQYVTQGARHNEFNLNLGFVKAEYTNDAFRSTLALQTGTYPSINYAGEPNAFAQLIQKATIGVALNDKMWIDAGVLGGHFGYEGLLSFDNELYTQALATEYTPYYQTGVQFSGQLSEKLSVRAVVINGWQNIYENNAYKSFGVGADYIINDQMTVSYGNYLGSDPVGGVNRTRFHQNVYFTYTKEKYKTALVLDYMLEGLNVDLPTNTNVLFITSIHQYEVAEGWMLAGRYEYVSDPTNVLFSSPTGTFQTNITTLAVRRYLSDNVIISLENKTYFGNENIWIDNNGNSESTNTVITAGITARLN